MKSLIWFGFVVLVLLQGADVWTTVKVLKGGGREMNPLVREVMRILGRVTGLILAKGLVMGTVGAILWFLPPHIWPTIAIWVLVVFYLWVVVTNFKELGRQRLWI